VIITSTPGTDLRPILNFTPRGKLWPPGTTLSPRGEVIPWGLTKGRTFPLGDKVHPKFTTRGKLHPWGQPILLKTGLWLGEFSPNAWLFPSGTYLKITDSDSTNYKSSPHLWATLSNRLILCINFDKNGLDYISDDFFINSSGVDVMITIFCIFCQFSAKKLAFF
jgi:hypothetical protein